MKGMIEKSALQGGEDGSKKFVEYAKKELAETKRQSQPNATATGPASAPAQSSVAEVC
tara:strand:- start:1143 stop:1316 length:174 start_codon:yes stop_codon:yes gene_type:complete